MVLVGSISIADRLSKPFAFVASFENFWPKVSERLCAGSVDCVLCVLVFHVVVANKPRVEETRGRERRLIHNMTRAGSRESTTSWSFLGYI
jgi:hypothetical protein